MKHLYLFLLFIHAFYVTAAQQDDVHFVRSDIYKGLSNNQVNTIFRDKNGFAWIGTMSGLNRFDGYNFKVYRSQPSDTNTITDNYISHVYAYPGNRLLIQTRLGGNIYDNVTERISRNFTNAQQQLQLPQEDPLNVISDQADNYWFVFPTQGLWRYHQGEIPSRYDTSALAVLKLPWQQVAGVSVGAANTLWIVYRNGYIQQLDWKLNTIIYSTSVFSNYVQQQPDAYSVYTASNGDCWLWGDDLAIGAFKISRKNGTERLSHYNDQAGEARLNSNIITGITEDHSGNIWIATDHGGVNIVHTGSGKISFLLNNAEDQRSLSQNSIISMFRDADGIIWIGTFKQGLNYYNQKLAKFPLYKHLAGNPRSLPYDDINRFVEDAKGNLWIGTNGGGLVYFDRAANTYKRWVAGPGSISNNIIVSLCLDHRQRLWIGSYFGGLDVFDGKTFKHFRHNATDTNSLADDRVWEIFEDSRQNLWIGTLDNGLDRYLPAAGGFAHLRAGRPNSVQSNYISVLKEDAKGNLWIGTSYGFSIMDSLGNFTHYGHDAQYGGLSNDNVMELFEDSRGIVWIGTREGLNAFDPIKKIYRRFTQQENGLPDNTILNILEDEQHYLWVSTSNGLTRMKVSINGKDINTIKLQVQNFDELNNLQAREFNENAALKTSRNELIFAGPFGFNLFRAADVVAQNRSSSIVITGLDVFNKPVLPGYKVNGHIILEKSLLYSKEIVLNYSDNVFTLSFAALDFSHNEKDRYAYIMEGFNTGWFITDGNLRRATFTNLDPGKYTFRVKLVNSDGSLSDNEAAITIRILPPFWQTPLAYLFYILLVAGMLWLARRLVLQRAKMRFAIEAERAEARRMHELDLMKIRFITNVSHEFRTPLSLILNPVDKLVKTVSDASQKKQLLMVHRNARRLLNLVNQLLDFRRMEVQEFVLDTVETDIVAFTRDIALSFSDIAEKKHIRFSFKTEAEKLVLPLDRDKMEKILFNLLSNAYKFTPDGGEVQLAVGAGTTNLGSLNDSGYVEIAVTDSGIGIAPENREKIFERFFQNEVPGNFINQGSGIGLAIVKEFVRLHHGTIEVRNGIETGSSFVVRLPYAPGADTTVSNEPAVSIEVPVVAAPYSVETPLLRGKRSTILIVEDNEDFRFYLKENLGVHFYVAEAANGKEGLQKVKDVQPDIVVTDVMMPVMTGLELAKKLKQDPRTAAIPVILLTARTEESQQLEGLETGANDYITKPFSFEILQSRIRNLLAEQKASKKNLKQITVKATDAVVESADEKLVQSALKLVEENMANATFSVEDLSRALHLSRVGLYKKMIALTGKTPIEFIKDIRMNRAIQLLENSTLTVSEIAYEVGFNDPKYFARAFKKAFGKLPSAWANKTESFTPLNEDSR